jgi:hypothetical protein
MEITIVTAEYDPGDSRTCASIAFDAQTPLGLLKFEAAIDEAGGYTGDGELSLAGETVDCVDWPDIGLPHYDAGRRAVERARSELHNWIHDALVDWCEARST